MRKHRRPLNSVSNDIRDNKPGHSKPTNPTTPLGPDTVVHELSELLGAPRTIAAPVFDAASDAVPEHVAPDAPAANRAISISIAIHDDERREFGDDELTWPRVASDVRRGAK